MKQYDFSEALTQLPDDMLLEARQVKRKKPMLGRVLRAAACLCVVLGLSMWIFGGKDGIVTGSGLLTVRVFAEDQIDMHLSLDVGVTYRYDSWCPGFDIAPGLPIELSVSEDVCASDNITFEVTTNDLRALVGTDGNEWSAFYDIMDTTFIVPNHTRIFWSTVDCSATVLQQPQVAFMDIVIFDGEAIIGYTCLRYDRASEPSGACFLSLVESISFDAKQNITRDILEDFIGKAHAKDIGELD